MAGSNSTTKNDSPDEEYVLEAYMTDLVDEVSCGLCFEVHRACKTGTFFLDESDFESQKQFEIVNERGLDVFGQPPTKKQYECICPNCQRNMAASRFAPHLEKCMGMGRNSSRIASKRIATNSRSGRGSDAESEEENEDNDSSYLPERRAKKLKREKSNGSSFSKRSRLAKARNTDSPSTSSEPVSCTQTFNYETMSIDEKRNLMVSTCGVISEHTKRMCTRSTRCPQHTDGQRRDVRDFLLGSSRSMTAVSSASDLNLDVDITCEADSNSEISTKNSLEWVEDDEEPA